MNELEIQRLVAGGEGLAFVEGKAVFVPGVLPGERVRASIVSRRRDFDRAVLEEVVSASPARVAPPCKLAGVCGGCDWLHISPEEQLRQKAAIVRETLRRIGHLKGDAVPLELDDVPMDGGPALGYRNRVQLHRSVEGGLGYMAAGSSRVVEVEQCPVVVPSVNGLFDGSVGLPEGLDRFIAFGQGDWVAREGLDDARDLEVSVLGRRILFSVGCFFQSNLAALERLVPFALDGLYGAAAADLYCGVGLFGAFLADRFRRVVAVESSTQSLGFARRNITGGDLDFYPMTVEQWIASGAAREPLDVAVVDPPRAGLSLEVRAWLGDLHGAGSLGRLVYVSCNPVTLARDLGYLVQRGFTLETLRLFDFYPQTSQVEAVARLR